MSAFLRLSQIEHGAASNDLALEVDVFLEHFLERHNLWHAVGQGEHDNAHRLL